MVFAEAIFLVESKSRVETAIKNIFRRQMRLLASRPRCFRWASFAGELQEEKQNRLRGFLFFQTSFKLTYKISVKIDLVASQSRKIRIGDCQRVPVLA
jgi:hypothetical protein